MEDKTPKYLEIVDWVNGQIEAGEILPGQKTQRSAQSCQPLFKNLRNLELPNHSVNGYSRTEGFCFPVCRQTGKGRPFFP